MYSFIGFGAYSNWVNYTVLNDRFLKFTYGVRSHVGLGFQASDRLIYKFYYTPVIWHNFKYEVDLMEQFLWIKFFKLNIGLAYKS